MTTTFAAATTVTPAGHGSYQADLRAEYAIGGTKPNGATCWPAWAGRRWPRPGKRDPNTST